MDKLYMPGKVWDEIADPFLNFYRATVAIYILESAQRDWIFIHLRPLGH